MYFFKLDDTPRIAAGTKEIKLCVCLKLNFGLNKLLEDHGNNVVKGRSGERFDIKFGIHNYSVRLKCASKVPYILRIAEGGTRSLRNYG
jgi:hypothetical protein